MSSKTGKPRGSERPELTSDHNVETGVEDTFPASDPVAATASQGARAVPPDEMMPDRGTAPAADTVTLHCRFRNAEAAKLAVEALVREGPLDRRCTSILPADDAVTLKVEAPRRDAARLGELLRKQGGA
jgi:hypothetical protein